VNIGLPINFKPGFDELDAARRSGRTRQPKVARQHPGIEHLGQRHVDGVVRAQVVSKFPHPIEQRLMGVALQIFDMLSAYFHHFIMSTATRSSGGLAFQRDESLNRYQLA
jgi:hypothetical protein